MSYQTSSKRSPPFWLLIGAKKTQVFWHQSEARTAATVWNWSGKTLSPGALLAVLYFSSCHIFFRPFRLFLVPTICPWVSEDAPRCDVLVRSWEWIECCLVTSRIRTCVDEGKSNDCVIVYAKYRSRCCYTVIKKSSLN